MNKILFLNYFPDGIRQAFVNNGYEVVIVPLFEEQDMDATKKAQWIVNNSMKDDITHVFSFDFDVDVAKVCYRCNVIYVSWIVDSPHIPLYCEFAEYNTNRIFIFDYDEYSLLNGLGRDNIYYMPLATDVPFLHKRALERGKKDFVHDVAFMGNLYDDEKNNMYDKITYLPEYSRGYLEGLFDVQMQLWGVDIFRTDAFTHIMNTLLDYVRIEFENSYDDIVYRIFFDTMLGKKVAQIERRKLCGELSKKYDFALYSGSDTSYNEQIKNYGYVDYLKEMPMMFYNSKINLNLNLHCISSGIPLRIIDIMACEGFCLTNYQPEVDQYFEDGVDVVMYSGFEDMIEKIDYYLKHDDERKAIAHNGYVKVKDKFDYSVIIPQIIECL